jgi:hypothetical protein
MGEEIAIQKLAAFSSFAQKPQNLTTDDTDNTDLHGSKKVQ